MLKRTLTRSMIALLVLLGPVVGAVAQITSGAVMGTVRDVQGGSVADVAVVLVNVAQGTRSVPVATDASGAFSIPNVPPGVYLLEASLRGFKTLQRADVVVSGGDRIAVPALTLETGASSEIVNVHASSAVLQALSGERSERIDDTFMRSLPLAGRNFVLAVGTGVAGVTGGTRLSGGGSNNLMIDGVSSMDTTNNSQMLPLNQDAVQDVKVLTQGYQAEFGRASGLQISAVTRSGTNQFHGSVYGVRTDSRWNSPSWANEKNGTNPALQKNDTFGFVVGGPIGKPAGNNRLFFFYGHEFRPSSSGGGTRRFTLPTDLEIAGDFSRSVDAQGMPIPQIYDPDSGLDRSLCTGTVANPGASAACFPGNRIPLARQYAPGASVLSMWKRAAGVVPNVTGALGYNYERTDPVVDDLVSQPVVRLDYQASPRLRFSGRYAGQRQRSDTLTGSIPGFNDTVPHRPVIHNLVGTASYVLDANTFAEAVWGVNVNYLGALPTGEYSDRQALGLSDFPLLFPDAGLLNPGYYQVRALKGLDAPSYDQATGRLNLPPIFGFGASVASPPPGIAYPIVNTNQTQDFSISLTRVMGRHTAKAGFYVNHSYKAQNTGAAGASTASFQGLVNFQSDPLNPYDTGFALSNAMLGVFSSYTQSSRFVEGSLVYNNIEGYIQDNWRVNDRLTLDYGLRLVHQQPNHDQFQQSSNFFVNEWSPEDAPLLYAPGCAAPLTPMGCAPANRRALDPRSGLLSGPGSVPAIGTIVAGTGNRANGIRQAGEGISKYGYTWPLLAYAPRLGAAFDLSGRQQAIVRGSYGLFFDRPDGNSVFGMVANAPFTSNPTLRYSRLSDLGSGQGLTTEGVQTMFGFEYENPLQKSSQWNIGLQVALPWASSVDVSYVGQHAWDRLQMLDINSVDFGTAFLPEYQDPTVVAPIPGLGTVTPDALRPYRGLGAVVMNTSYAWNTYHSIQTSFTRRLGQRVSFGLHYTYTISSTASVAPRFEHGVDGSYRERADQKDAQALFGDAGTMPHVLRGNFVWDAPDYEGRGAFGRVLGAVARDWTIAGVISAQSGAAYDIGLQYQIPGANQALTGSPSFAPRTMVVAPNSIGSGCSANQYAQFNNAVEMIGGGLAPVAFRGPSGPGGPDGPSVGLESGTNYLRGCPSVLLDLSLARHIRLPGGKSVQIRLDAFNALDTVIFTSRNSILQIAAPGTQVMTSPQYLADGTLDPRRLRPQDAGFGAVTGAAAMRSLQAQIRLSF